jgi:cytochrome P450
MNVNANPLIFWFLLRIYSSPTYLAQIRSEIAPYITSSVSQPLILNVPGILKSCNLLKAAYYECLRIDVSSVSNKVAHSDFYVTESAADAFGGPPQSYLIRKGEYVQIYHNMHQNDPRYFPDPDIFRPERFLIEDEEENGVDEKRDTKGAEGKVGKGKLVATQGTIRPFGGGVTFCKGSKVAEREILLYVASVLTVWDAEPVGGEWKTPEHQRSSGSFLPKKDIRVRLTRRI